MTYSLLFPVGDLEVADVAFAIGVALISVALTALLALWLEASGAMDRVREKARRDRHAEEKQREKHPKRSRRKRRGGGSGGRRRVPATASGLSLSDHGVYASPPEGSFGRVLDSLATALREIEAWLRNLLGLALMVPVIPVLYIVLLSGLFWWLKPVMEAHGASPRTANAALLGDFALAVCFGAWSLTGFRRRSRRERLIRSVSIVVVIGLATAAFVGAGPAFGVLMLVFGTWIYLKQFS
jgi:hypothetical protein